MATVHVLPLQNTGRHQLVFHVPVPAGANSANVLWSDCIVKARLQGASILSDISTTERDQLAAGTLLERFLEVSLGSDWDTKTDAQKATLLTTIFNLESSSLQAAMQRQLKDYGRTVP